MKRACCFVAFLLILVGVILLTVFLSKKKKITSPSSPDSSGSEDTSTSYPDDYVYEDLPDDAHKDADENYFFQPNFSGTRKWLGPEWWGNPMTDWKLVNGEIISPAALDRTLCLLPFEPTSDATSYTMKTTISMATHSTPADKLDQFAAGFRFGRKSKIPDYRATLLSANQYIDAVVRADGKLAIDDVTSHNSFDMKKGNIKLEVVASIEGRNSKVMLSAKQHGKLIFLEKIFEKDDILGGMCVLSNGPGAPGIVYSTFRDFSVGGDMLEMYWERNFGPILWTQYMLNGNHLKLQAQLPMLAGRVPVQLWIENDSGDLIMAQETEMNLNSYTALFDLQYADTSKARKYEVRMKMFKRNFKWHGFIRADPKDSTNLKIACFSCDNGYAFPLAPLVEQVKNQNPDLMYFAGDQIYEIYGGFGVARTASHDRAMMEFLRKYFQFGWTWRELLRDRPSVIIPDDHDVFQGNLFGHGGIAMPNKPPYSWGEGGYIMPGKWINAVEAIHVGHLPKPAVDITLPIGIKPYFTSFTYGGVGFAVLEDRKFKTAPGKLPWNRRKFGTGGQLLGKEQEQFLKKWAQDWGGQSMKIALSQTIFAKATTHEEYTLDRINYSHDSGGWPRDARNRAVKILGDNNVFSIHGDQHLGILLRHGVNDFNDAGYAFMVPGTANGWPRAWWPGWGNGERPDKDKCFTGQYKDDVGHPISVIAAANPEYGSNELDKDRMDPFELAYRKGSGYGLVILDKKGKTADIHMYRTGRDEEQFPTFPQSIYIGGADDRKVSPDTDVNLPPRSCTRRTHIL